VLSEIAMAGQNPSPTIVERLVRASRDRSLRLKAMNFGVIGVVNTLIDYGVFLLGYYLLGLPLVPANILSWLVAVSGSYVMNSFITFAAESGRQLRWRDYGTFVVSGIAGLIANTTTLVVLSYVVPVLVAKVFAIGVSFLVNFSLSHLVVFRRGRPAAKEPR
jgi:putative flippase GtrA